MATIVGSKVNMCVAAHLSTEDHEVLLRVKLSVSPEKRCAGGGSRDDSHCRSMYLGLRVFHPAFCCNE